MKIIKKKTLFFQFTRRMYNMVQTDQGRLILNKKFKMKTELL